MTDLSVLWLQTGMMIHFPWTVSKKSHYENSEIFYLHFCFAG